MIVAELALEEERHGEASKEVKMPHQYSGKFFVKRENKNQKHQNSNLHHLYIAEILIKLRAIYDATVWKGIVARFKISDRPFLECPTGLYGTLRERFSRDPITPQVIYDATLWKDMAAGSQISDTPKGTLCERFFAQTAIIYVQEGKERESISDRFFARTQKSWSICDITVCKGLNMGNATTLHSMLSITERHQTRYIIYDAMS